MSDVTPGLVSVIVPCYRQAHFLAAAVDSALAQSYPAVEVVVVDDGSPDDAAEVAARYAAEGAPVRLVRQTNQGLAAARNAGVRESKGEFLVFLDADDRLLPKAVESGLLCHRENPGCAFVFGGLRFIDANGAPSGEDHLPGAARDYYRALLRENHIYTPGAVMFRRAAFLQAVGFNESAAVKGAEDYDLYLRVAKSFPIESHDVVVVEYRRHGANMSRKSAMMLVSAINIMRSQRVHAREDARLQEDVRQGIRHWQKFYGERLVDDLRASLRSPGRRAETLRGAWVLLRYSPKTLARHLGRKLHNLARGVESDFASPE